MSALLAFCDTETTSLRPDRRAWEIAVITRDTAGNDAEHRWFVNRDDLDLGNADVMSLKIGRYYDRHPQEAGLPLESTGDLAGGNFPPGEYDVLLEVERLTRGAHIVGAVPNFDTEVLGARMRAHGICPSWHYHLCDVEALAVGWLHRHAAILENRHHSIEEATALRALASPPWKSDDLSAATRHHGQRRRPPHGPRRREVGPGLSTTQSPAGRRDHGHRKPGSRAQRRSGAGTGAGSTRLPGTAHRGRHRAGLPPQPR